MRWWCSAQATTWDWTWQAYPGIWLFVAALAAGYFRWIALPGSDSRSRNWFLGGLVVLWLALDWPLGALGAGYLASVHMLQYLLIALVAPALLLLGIPAAAWAAFSVRRPGRPIHFVTHPAVALTLFALVQYFTHIPSVVDGWMSTQMGSFGIDMLWLGGGVLFWWPVLSPVPERPRFPHGLKMGYLFLATVLNTMPYAFLTFGDLPFYGIYELAPPVSGITTRQDQQIAGLLMKMGGGVILWTAISVLFFRWFRHEETT